MTNIITFTTDWGSSDNYSAIFKAHILTELRDATMLDISHDVDKFNLQMGVYLLKSSYHYFPEGSIHVFDIDCMNPQQVQACIIAKKNNMFDDLYFRDYLAVKYKGHYFLAMNNGFFSILCDDIEDIQEVVKLRIPQEYKHIQSFNAVSYFVRPAISLAKKTIPLSELGKPYNLDLIESIKLVQPLIKKSEEFGDIIEFGVKYVDSYGNITTDLHRDVFNKIAKGRNKISIYIKGMGNTKVRIGKSYSDVAKNYLPVALFNLAGYLELSVKFSKIASVLDVKSANVYDHRFSLSFIDKLEEPEDTKN